MGRFNRSRIAAPTPLRSNRSSWLVQRAASIPLPCSQSETDSSDWVHRGPWPEIRLIWSGTDPAWSLANTIYGPIHGTRLNAKPLQIVPIRGQLHGRQVGRTLALCYAGDT